MIDICEFGSRGKAFCLCPFLPLKISTWQNSANSAQTNWLLQILANAGNRIASFSLNSELEKSVFFIPNNSLFNLRNQQSPSPLMLTSQKDVMHFCKILFFIIFPVRYQLCSMNFFLPLLKKSTFTLCLTYYLQSGRFLDEIVMQKLHQKYQE